MVKSNLKTIGFHYTHHPEHVLDIHDKVLDLFKNKKKIYFEDRKLVKWGYLGIIP